MTFRSAWVTLKQHRFEFAFAFIAVLAAAIIGLSIVLRIDALHVPAACLDSALRSEDGSSLVPDCLASVRAGYSILGETFLDGEGTVPLSIMGVLPFLVGVLGGVPIVARELENRTAQTAWSLFGSRSRWLVQQTVPIALVLGIGLAVAAFIASLVAADVVAWGSRWSWLIGLHGPLLLIRAFAAFGVGLMVGALLGRTLPAFLFASVIAILLSLAAGNLREAWSRTLPSTPLAGVSPDTGEYEQIPPGSVQTGWGVQTPEGDVVSMAAARQVASAAGVPSVRPDDEQDQPALQWFESKGYVLLPVGITDEAALGWTPYDALLFGVLGVLSTTAAVVVTNRRRPV